MKRNASRFIFSILVLLTLSFIAGCTSMDIETEEKSSYYLVPYDLQEANRTLIEAHEDGKDKICPKEYAAAEEAINHFFNVYDECRDDEAIALAADAIAKVNALCPFVAPPAPPTPEPVPAPAPKMVEKLTLHINYDTDDATIKMSESAKIDRAIIFINKYPESRLIIEGHTDSRASDAYNYALSFSRAIAVKDYLVEKGGIDESRITRVTGYGEVDPIASNDTEYGRAENRRTEILIISE